MGYNVAVVGATGNVGKQMLAILAERKFPTDNVYALASSKSKGKEISFGENEVLIVQDLDGFDFSGVDIVLSSAGASVSEKFAHKAAAAGAVVIDNTSHFRMDENVPLVIPEVNPGALKNFRDSNIIANPNCSTIQMLVALQPLHEAAKIKRIVGATYQSVSGSGKEAMDELYDQTKNIYMYDKADPVQFTKQIAFNAIPHIDVFMDDGATKEEWKMVVETKKIMDPKIEVHMTCVRVPVFISHAEALNIEFEEELSADEAREILSDAPGCAVIDRRENGGYITPVEAVGEDAVYISRIRNDSTVKHGLSLWVVSDNVRKGAALNAVQIAEELVENYGL